jgi:hypothetical protein
MKANYRLLLAVLAGILIGATGISALNAQNTTPPAYLIEEIDVHDPDTFRAYVAQVPATLAPFKGRYLVRVGRRSLFKEPHRSPSW